MAHMIRWFLVMHKLPPTSHLFHLKSYGVAGSNPHILVDGGRIHLFRYKVPVMQEGERLQKYEVGLSKKMKVGVILHLSLKCNLRASKQMCGRRDKLHIKHTKDARGRFCTHTFRGHISIGEWKGQRALFSIKHTPYNVVLAEIMPPWPGVCFNHIHTV